LRGCAPFNISNSQFNIHNFQDTGVSEIFLRCKQNGETKEKKKDLK